MSRETFTNRVGKGCARDMYLQDRKWKRRNEGVRVMVKKKKENRWFKEINLEGAPTLNRDTACLSL